MFTHCYVATNSIVDKLAAAVEFDGWNRVSPGYKTEFHQVDVGDLGLPPQPATTDNNVHSIHECAVVKVDALEQHLKENPLPEKNENGDENCWFLFALANGLDVEHPKNRPIRAQDVCICAIRDQAGRTFFGTSNVKFECAPVLKFVEASEMVTKEVERRPGKMVFGYSKTVGEIMVELGLAKNATNWMMDAYGCDHEIQKRRAVAAALKALHEHYYPKK